MKKFEHRKKSFTIFAIVISVILLAGIPAVSAYDAALDSGTTTYPDEKVSLSITGLLINDVVSVQLKSTNLVTTGSTVTFDTFNMPFSFNTGKAKVNVTTTTGTASTTTLTVNSVSKSNSIAATTNSINTSTDISAGAYTISLANDVLTSGSTVGISYLANGSVSTKPDPAYLNFTIKGVSTGTLQIIVNDGSGGADKLNTNVNIIARPPPPTPTPASSEGSPGGPSAPSALAQVVAPVIVRPVVNPVVGWAATIATVTVPTNAGGTFTSLTTVDVGSVASLTFPPGTAVYTPAGNPVSTLQVSFVNLPTQVVPGQIVIFNLDIGASR